MHYTGKRTHGTPTKKKPRQTLVCRGFFSMGKYFYLPKLFSVIKVESFPTCNHQKSKLDTASALLSMNSRRGSTASPIKVLKI